MVALEHAAARPRHAARRSKARPGKYRTLSIGTMAEILAQEVIQANTDFDGRERAPMRMAEARITLSDLYPKGTQTRNYLDQLTALSA